MAGSSDSARRFGGLGVMDHARAQPNRVGAATPGRLTVGLRADGVAPTRATPIAGVVVRLAGRESDAGLDLGAEGGPVGRRHGVDELGGDGRVDVG